jgi:hypothetical protein
VKGLPSRVRSFYRQVRELIAEGFDSKSKSSERQNVSKLLALSSAVCRQGFFGELVQLTLANIFFDLVIPSFSIELKKPPSEGGKFGWRKILDFVFDIFDFTH